MACVLPALLYLAAAVFLIGMAWRTRTWLRTPVPLKIALTPAPQSVGGVAVRLAGELFGFRSLLKADPFLWIPAWLFHVSLVCLFFGHLGGLVIPKLTEGVLGLSEDQFEHVAQVGGSVIGLLAMLFLLVLLLRRLALERPRWISTFSDYFALVLLLLIVITGNQMRFTSHFDLLQSRRFVAGWLGLHPVAAPHELWFTAHILLISTLLIYIPFSKLVHAGGATLLSPTLNQMNDPRIRRHINPWDPTPAAKRPTPP